MAKSSNADDKWVENDTIYPRKRGICDTCGQRDDLKLAFDQVHYICINGHACILRWTKQVQSMKASGSV
jgi:hypothetical protein